MVAYLSRCSKSQPVAAGVGSLGQNDLRTQPIWLIPAEFERHIQQGYQATATWNQGTIYDPGSDRVCRWQYSTQPVYGWVTKVFLSNPQLAGCRFCPFLNQDGRF